MIEESQQPVIIAGVEIHRFGLREEVMRLADRNQIPMCATLLGKSVVSERHPLYLGVYEGAMGRESVRRYVEESDCVILLGTFMTDINLGIYTAHLDPSKCIYATSEKLRIQHHHFHDVLLADFVKRLAKSEIKVATRTASRRRHRPNASRSFPKPDQKITVKRLFQRINETLGDNMVVVADVGDSLFAASDLTIHRHTEFLAPAYYTSMGFAIPAAIGVQAANSKLRPIVLVGDGAFQMTCMELSTAVAQRLQPGRARAQQSGLHDRAVPAGRPVQRHPELELSPAARPGRRRLGLRDPHGRRTRSSAQSGPAEQRHVQPAQYPPRAEGHQPGPRTAHPPPREKDLNAAPKPD